jgi:hypothetical protein
MASEPIPNCPAKSPKDLLDYSKVDIHEFNYSMKPWIRRLFVKQAREAGGNRQPVAAVNALVYLWIPFNSWLAQTVVDDTKSESDRYLVAAAGCDARLSAQFDDLLRRNAKFRATAERFRSFWPIFKVRWLIDNRIMPWGIQEDDRGRRLERAAYRDLCFSKNPDPTRYRPHCYAEHQDPELPLHLGSDPAKVPLDWPHTLNAIYQVRCSLFHGGKTFANSRDVELLRSAYKILWDIWGEPQLSNN